MVRLTAFLLVVMTSVTLAQSAGDSNQGEGVRNGQQGARSHKRMKKENKVKAKASTDHEYLGCYRYNMENGMLLKNGKKSFFDKTDQALCRAHCEEYDTAFYALEDGDVCWCPTSPDINDYIIDEVGICDKPCTGDPSIFCGGVSSISMFEYQDVDSSTSTGEYEEYETSSGTVPEDDDDSSGTVQEDDDDGFSSSTESVCTNGVSGIESGGVCCEISCGQCGGSGCSALGNGAESCCTTTILEFGEVCGVAPCII